MILDEFEENYRLVSAHNEIAPTAFDDQFSRIFSTIRETLLMNVEHYIAKNKVRKAVVTQVGNVIGKNPIHILNYGTQSSNLLESQVRSLILELTRDPNTLADALISYFQKNPPSLVFFAQVTFPSLFGYYQISELIQKPFRIMNILIDKYQKGMLTEHIFISFFECYPSFSRSLWNKVFKKTQKSKQILDLNAFTLILAAGIKYGLPFLTRDHYELITKTCEQTPLLFCSAFIEKYLHETYSIIINSDPAANHSLEIRKLGNHITAISKSTKEKKISIVGTLFKLIHIDSYQFYKPPTVTREYGLTTYRFYTSRDELETLSMINKCSPEFTKQIHIQLPPETGLVPIYTNIFKNEFNKFIMPSQKPEFNPKVKRSYQHLTKLGISVLKNDEELYEKFIHIEFANDEGLVKELNDYISYMIREQQKMIQTDSTTIIKPLAQDWRRYYEINQHNFFTSYEFKQNTDIIKAFYVLRQMETISNNSKYKSFIKQHNFAGLVNHWSNYSKNTIPEIFIKDFQAIREQLSDFGSLNRNLVLFRLSYLITQLKELLTFYKLNSREDYFNTLLTLLIESKSIFIIFQIFLINRLAKNLNHIFLNSLNTIDQSLTDNMNEIHDFFVHFITLDNAEMMEVISSFWLSFK